MKHSLHAAATILLFFVSSGAGAQELPPPIQVVRSVLGLSDAQTRSLLAMVQARDVAVRPLAEQMRQKNESLARLLEAPSPDAAAIGQLIIEVRAIESAVRLIVQQAAAEFEQTLTAEQRTRLEHLRQAAPACEVSPAFRAAGLL